MRVTNNDQLASELLSEMMTEIEEDRRAMHPSVTDLIDCLTKTYYNSSVEKMDFTEQTKIMFLIGLGLERNLLVSRKTEPVYGETDGIHWHVDSIDHGLIEMKSTRANPKKADAGEFSGRWLRQVKSYCVANNVRHVDIAVVYLIQAQFKVYRLEFDQMELDIHWRWMRERRDRWNKAKEENQAPEAFKWNDGESKDSWECRDCQYKIICELKGSLGIR
jgi:hypothetical protein